MSPVLDTTELRDKMSIWRPPIPEGGPVVESIKKPNCPSDSALSWIRASKLGARKKARVPLLAARGRRAPPTLACVSGTPLHSCHCLDTFIWSWCQLVSFCTSTLKSRWISREPIRRRARLSALEPIFGRPCQSDVRCPFGALVSHLPALVAANSHWPRFSSPVNGNKLLTAKQVTEWQRSTLPAGPTR